VLKTRVIPTLLYKDFGLVKGVGFDSWRPVGSPMQAVKVYNLRGVDELVLLDVTATLQGRGPDLDMVDELADECFMPLTVGGGVRSLDDVGDLLRAGADKVALGTAAMADTDLVRRASDRFGAQCVVVSVDTRRHPDTGRVSVWTRAGTHDTGLDPVEVACRAEASGAGEILLQSADRDGSMEGYDLDTISRVSAAVAIPVVASGGCGRYDDMVDAVRVGGASAVAAAAMFHFTQQTPAEAKAAMAAAGIPVRR